VNERDLAVCRRRHERHPGGMARLARWRKAGWSCYHEAVANIPNWPTGNPAGWLPAGRMGPAAQIREGAGGASKD
jgi:hypothetical protein